MCVHNLSAATGKSSSSLCPPRDMHQQGGSSQAHTAMQRRERLGLLPFPHGNLKSSQSSRRRMLWMDQVQAQTLRKLGAGLEKIACIKGSEENSCRGVQLLCKTTQSLFKPRFQPQSDIQVGSLHLCCLLLRTGRRDGIHLPGRGPGAPGASSSAAGRCPQAWLLPAASSPGRLSLRTSSHGRERRPR